MFVRSSLRFDLVASFNHLHQYLPFQLYRHLRLLSLLVTLRLISAPLSCNRCLQSFTAWSGASAASILLSKILTCKEHSCLHFLPVLQCHHFSSIIYMKGHSNSSTTVAIPLHYFRLLKSQPATHKTNQSRRSFKNMHIMQKEQKEAPESELSQFRIFQAEANSLFLRDESKSWFSLSN